jgi:hypothetical protein
VERRALLERRAVAVGSALGTPGDLHRGGVDLLGEDARGEEEAVAEQGDLVRGDGESGLLLRLLRGAPADTRLSPVLRLEDSGDQLLEEQVRTGIGNGQREALPEVRSRAEPLPGQHLDSTCAAAPDEDRDRVRDGPVHHVDPVVAGSRAVGVPVATDEPLDVQEALVAARARRDVLHHLDAGHHLVGRMIHAVEDATPGHRTAAGAAWSRHPA